MLAAATYLENLNPEQRRAVEHGAAGPGPFTPLLVIAGAGSGKTNTLAHRVAHLIVNGADPRGVRVTTSMSKKCCAPAPNIAWRWRSTRIPGALTWIGAGTRPRSTWAA